MREQSHIEAMREAVRGDLERARNRRASIFERPAAPPVEIRENPPPPLSNTETSAEPVPVPTQEPEPVPAEAPPQKPPRRWAFWRR